MVQSFGGKNEEVRGQKGGAKVSCWWIDLCDIQESVGELYHGWFENGKEIPSVKLDIKSQLFIFLI